MTPKIRTLVVTSVVVPILSLLWTPGAVHGQEVRCSKDKKTSLLSCIVVAPPSAPNVRTSLGGDVGPPLQWSRTLILDSPGAPPTCPARPVDTPAGPVDEFGRPWLIVVQNTETLEFVLIRSECQYSGDDPPDPPPPPPTPGSIALDQEPVFALDTGINPPITGRGVSQLPTWFWCNNAGSINVSATVRPWRASAVATVEQVVWAIEGPDGEQTVSGPSCGREPDIDSDGSDAAAAWTPNEPGISTIQLTTTWSAEWTYTFFDPVLGPVDLGTFDLGLLPIASAPFDYDVYEIQTVGVPTPEP